MHPYIAIPATVALVLRAYLKKSLTTGGIVAAALTAVVHALHPWSVFYALLVVFFLGGTAVTKVKHDVKARLTLSSTGATGGEGARTHIQVLANSAMASILIFLHHRQLTSRGEDAAKKACWPHGGDLLVVGIISNYAAVAADTFSSELGILSKGYPRLLTSWNFRKVPPGTNGGISLLGTLAGFLGAFTIAVTSIFLPFCSEQELSPYSTRFAQFLGRDDRDGWRWQEKIWLILAITVWGGIGSLLDSALGGWFQASVVDTRTGKIVEGTGGGKVPIGPRTHDKKHDDKASRHVESGLGLLDNNSVNFLMAFLMSVGGMIVMSYVWDVPLQSILSPLI